MPPRERTDTFYRVTVIRDEAAEIALAEIPTLGAEEEADRLHAWFSDETLAARFSAQWKGRISRIDSQDWLEKWRDSLRPIRVGNLLVLPAPDLPAEPEPGDIVVEIEPGMAFGTGEHETTRGCLAFLSRFLHPGSDVLDLGCGSGILAVAAKKCGAGRVVAVDTDGEALRIAGENARRNGVEIELEDRIPENRRFDLVLANIQSSVLLPLWPEIKTAILPRGVAVLSGILVSESLEFPGLIARLEIGEWVTIALQP